MSIQMDIVKLM